MVGAGDKECHPHSTQEDSSEVSHPDALSVGQRRPSMKPWAGRGGCEEQWLQAPEPPLGLPRP